MNTQHPPDTWFGYQQHYYPYLPQKPPNVALGVASMVVGIIAVMLAFVPFIGWISFLLGPAAVVMGVIALANNLGKGQGIAGIATGAAALVIVTIGTLVFNLIMGAAPEPRQANTDGPRNTVERAEREASPAPQEAATADEESTAEVTEDESEWTEVLAISGSASQRSEVFTIENDARLVYEFETETSEVVSMASVYLVPAGGEVNQDVFVPELQLRDDSEGDKNLYSTGDYFLEIEPFNYASWTVTVEEQQ